MSPWPWLIERAARASSEALSLSPITQWYLDDEWLGWSGHASDSQTPQWLGAPTVLHNIRLLSWTEGKNEQGESFSLRLTECIASNRSWVNEHSLQYLSARLLHLRGEWLQENEQRIFLLRNIWPADWSLQHELDAAQKLTIEQRVRQQRGGARREFSVERLWAAPELSVDVDNRQYHCGQHAIGWVLNGAQGDDDEAHGGHFSAMMGSSPDSAIDLRDLVVANYYNPDIVSEKGILPAFAPLDAYLTDLNAGQQFYRPSDAVVVVLDKPDCLHNFWAESALQMRALYEHQFNYDHALMNCTGITMDALRRAGMRIPAMAASSYVLGMLAFAQSWLKERDRPRALRLWHYFSSELSRVLPAQAYRATVHHLLSLLSQRRAASTEWETKLLTQVQAVYWLHYPQLPSSRKMGREPVFTLAEYPRRVPELQSKWQVVPTRTRELPPLLRQSMQGTVRV